MWKQNAEKEDDEWMNEWMDFCDLCFNIENRI